MPVTGKDIARALKEDTYYGVGYSSKKGFSVGAQSLNTSDDTSSDEGDDHSGEAREKVSKALSKNKGYTGTTRTAKRGGS